MKRLCVLILLIFICIGCGKKEEENITEEMPTPKEETKEISVIDVNSNTRPYAVVINNSTVAVKVQTGLQQAYIVYEFPVEGGLTRLMALYKDASDITIGTIRFLFIMVGVIMLKMMNEIENMIISTVP